MMMKPFSEKKNRLNLLPVIVALMIILISSFIEKPLSQVQTEYTISFEEFKTGTTASLRAISVIDKSVVWASGSKGTFLLTTDGGKTWKCDTIPGETRNDFRSIHAWDKNRAMVFGTGTPGKAYLTTDGGKTWKKIYENETKGIFFNSLRFSDKYNGIAVSDPVDDRSFVIKTSDGGITWTRLFNIPPLNTGEGNFAASNTCIDYKTSGRAWIISGAGSARVFYSVNNGSEWKVTDAPIIHNTPASGIFSVSFLNDKTGVIVGGTYDKMELSQNTAAFSSDGGETWTASETMPSGFRSCAVWLKENMTDIVFAIGPTGSDYSVDFGKTWIYSGENGYHTMMAVSGKSTGFAAGSKGRIAKFTFIKNR
jgi:photosystem II stability/assembly factor-like uncharacterized protein